MLIEDLDFPLTHDLRLVALQGDFCLKKETTADGGIWRITDANRSRRACLRLVEHAQAKDAHVALIPGMHLNTEQAHDGADNFVIYRLKLGDDGSIASEQHVPRWRKQASAA